MAVPRERAEGRWYHTIIRSMSTLYSTPCSGGRERSDTSTCSRVSRNFFLPTRSCTRWARGLPHCSPSSPHCVQRCGGFLYRAIRQHHQQHMQLTHDAIQFRGVKSNAPSSALSYPHRRVYCRAFLRYSCAPTACPESLRIHPLHVPTRPPSLLPTAVACSAPPLLHTVRSPPDARAPCCLPLVSAVPPPFSEDDVRGSHWRQWQP